jgi:hypothetical protein
MLSHPLTLHSHGGIISTMQSHVYTHAHALGYLDPFRCPTMPSTSGLLPRRGNVDNVAAAHDFCRAHADCSQQGCMQKKPKRLWPVIGSRAPSGKYCITTKTTHRSTWCLGMRLLRSVLGVWADSWVCQSEPCDG